MQIGLTSLFLVGSTFSEEKVDRFELLIRGGMILSLDFWEEIGIHWYGIYVRYIIVNNVFLINNGKHTVIRFNRKIT